MGEFLFGRTKGALLILSIGAGTFFAGVFLMTIKKNKKLITLLSRKIKILQVMH
jgi:hypothetical protein